MQKVFTINLNNPQAILWCQTNTVFCHPIFLDQFPVSLWARSYHLDKLQIFRAISHWWERDESVGKREKRWERGGGGNCPQCFISWLPQNTLNNINKLQLVQIRPIHLLSHQSKTEHHLHSHPLLSVSHFLGYTTIHPLLSVSHSFGYTTIHQ